MALQLGLLAGVARWLSSLCPLPRPRGQQRPQRRHERERLVDHDVVLGLGGFHQYGQLVNLMR